jgi:hypothetical protein
MPFFYNKVSMVLLNHQNIIGFTLIAPAFVLKKLGTLL